MGNTGNASGIATFSACRDDESMHRLASPRTAYILNPMNIKIGVAHYASDK
jgi:hypothetical protein